MQSRPDTLLVRQHERVACNLSALVEATGDHRARIRLARSVGDGSGVVQATAIDCSHGGIGITASVFFPKRALLKAWVIADEADSPMVFEGLLRVQRVAMVSREPRYYLGAAFDSSVGAEQISRLLQHAARAGAGAPGQGVVRAQ